MSQSARNNSHVSSACVNCRRRKRKCSGTKPTCALCAEKNVHARFLGIEHHCFDELNDCQCEWTVERDGRRGCVRERDALRVENEQLKSELAFLQAQLRGAGVENAPGWLTCHAVQTQQLQLWVPDVPFDCAGLALQTSVAQQDAAPGGAFADTTTHALAVPIDSWLYSYRAQDDLPASTEDAAGPSVDATRLHAVNVFGPHEPPLSTSDAIPHEFHK